MAQLPTSLDASLSTGAAPAGISLGAIVAPPTSALLIVVSLAVHAIGAVGLGYLPVASDGSGPRFEEVAVTLIRPPPPAIDRVEPEPVVMVEPELLAPPAINRPTPSTPEVVPEAPRVLEPTPAPVAAAPVTAAPPSADDIFGDPLAAALTAEGSGGAHTVASGSGSGLGSRPGGTGTSLGAGGGASSEPTIDDAASRRRARMAYKRELERILRARSAYPRAALRERLEGRVELGLRIAADGSVLAVRVARSSTYALLDNAAVESARADRLPAPPAAAGLSASDEITVCLVYVVR